MRELRDLIARNRNGSGEALPSVCSAHPDVLAASLLLADEWDVPLLIEATSNQVNQFGGYTGMTPPDFISFVRGIAARSGVDAGRVLFGGDHLGPQAWRDQPATIAMANARDLVAAYVKAGFTKIHLDCSEGCACEAATADPTSLSYMFGTEVPPPGGARAEEGPIGIAPTEPANARATIGAHRDAFAALGLEQTAWQRAVGLVVQPGLEFAPDHIHRFDTTSPDLLSPVLEGHDGLSFEAHSTDYQYPDVFPALAQRHFAVLKVGPALTFAYRQAIYALDGVASWLAPDANRQPIAPVMEALMLETPKNWAKHYAGDAATLKLLRHFSYADRIRYYWAQPQATEAVGQLLAALGPNKPVAPLLEQYFAPEVIARAERLEARSPDWARALIYAQVQTALVPYFACVGVAT